MALFIFFLVRQKCKIILEIRGGRDCSKENLALLNFALVVSFVYLMFISFQLKDFKEYLVFLCFSALFYSAVI